METIYTCQSCGERVLPGEGYLHTTKEQGTYWGLHHRWCYDFSGEICFAVPRHWSDLLTAHAEYVSGVRRANVSRAQAKRAAR